MAYYYFEIEIIMYTYTEVEQYYFPDQWRERRSFPAITAASETMLDPAVRLLIDDRVKREFGYCETDKAIFELIRQEFDQVAAIQPYVDALCDLFIQDQIISQRNTPDNTVFVFPGTGGRVLKGCLPCQIELYGTSVYGKVTRIKEEGQVTGYDMTEFMESAEAQLNGRIPEVLVIWDDVSNTFGTVKAIRNMMIKRGLITDQTRVISANAVSLLQETTEGVDIEPIEVYSGALIWNSEQVKVNCASSKLKKQRGFSG